MIEFSSIDWNTILHVIEGVIASAGAVGTIVACIKAKDWKGAFAAFGDLMNPYIPQSEEQTKLIESGKVDDATWKMQDGEFDRIYKELCAIKANVSKDALKSAIAQAEAQNQVEYAIRCCRNEKPETYPTVFISYGVGEIYESYYDAQSKIINHAVMTYSIAG